MIAKDKQIVSLGFNGFPPTIEDKPEWLNNRSEKYRLTIHAECNCISNSRGFDLTGCTLFLWPLPPCGECSKHIASVGINRVVLWNSPPCSPWVEDSRPSRYLGEEDAMFVFNASGIEYIKVTEIDN